MENIKINKNKKKMIIFIVLLLIAGGVTGMYFSGLFNFNSEDDQALVENKDAIICFMNKDPQTISIDETKDGVMINYEVVKIEFINNTNKIKGIYNIIPFSDEAQRGNFEGVLENDVFKTKYQYQTAGTKEELQQEFKLGNGGLLVGKNIDNQVEFQKFLGKVDCGDTEFKQNIKIY